jgi:TIR domain-containing protein
MDEGYLFLSYARVDAPLVKRASTLLAQRGWKTWVDRSDIPSAADWMSAIRAGIEEADGFVFVMTPHSIASRMCRVELSIATELAKRLLPLMPIDAATWAAETAKITPDPKLASAAEIPAELTKLDYIDLADFVDRPDPFAALMDELVAAASRDLDWLRRHKRLQQDVRRWVDTRYAPSVLLREPLLAEAEQMLTMQDKDPVLTTLQREFVVTSRSELTRELEREAAQLAARILDLPPERLHVGLMLALEGRDRYLATPRLEGALRTLFAQCPQRYLVTHEAPIYSIAFSRDGELFATAAADGIRVIDSASAKLLRNWRGATPATCVEFLGDGGALPSAGPMAERRSCGSTPLRVANSVLVTIRSPVSRPVRLARIWRRMAASRSQ